MPVGVDYAETAMFHALQQELKMKDGIVSFKSNYGYLMPWNEYYTPKALNAIFTKRLACKSIYEKL